MPKSKAYTVRLSSRGERIIEEAVEVGDFSRADILRQAFWYYVANDPDDFGPHEQSPGSFDGRQDEGTGTALRSNPTSTTDSTEHDIERTTKQSQSSTEESQHDLLEGMYDPLREL